ncbi:GIY-YIG nuclease family protein, partial [Streptococcus pyogenes]
DTYRNKLAKTFETLNKLFEIDGVKISKELLTSKLKQLDILYKYQKQIEIEKELLKAQKEEIREQQKAEKEIQQAKAKLEKEERQFNNEMSKLLKYLNGAQNEIEQQIYADKIKELEDKIKELEKDKEDVLKRESNTRAGYVYIISNIGSFGENVYKIGMTRRLEPMDRINELSSASVPFPFDVHALIFSEDAPALESTLHNYFRNKEVNKVNPRKEFFKVDLQEIKEVVLKEHNNTVHFTDLAVAEQYYESIKKDVVI